MEHPLRVDEFIPSSDAQIVHDEPVVAPAPAAAPLPPLPSLPPADALLLRPNDPDYAKYLPAINKRRQLSPALRAVCKTEHAVAVMVDWVRSNHLKFAVRCGGHSYEGLSQSADVVIDVRGLKQIAIDKPAGLVTAGSGVSLFELYQALAARGLALQAGSCPTVGISGHLTGGGHGLLARSHGLTCDTLQQVTVIDSQARTLQASADHGAGFVLGLPRRRWRQLWRRDRVQDRRVSAGDGAGVRRDLDPVADACRAAVRGLAVLGAACAEHDHADHEGRARRQQQGHAALYRPVRRHRCRAAQPACANC